MAFIGINRNFNPPTEQFEPDEKVVTRALRFGSDIEYHWVKVTSGNAVLIPVTLKGGPRTDGPEREIVEIVAGPDDVGFALIDK